jgi:hypothetical protein
MAPGQDTEAGAVAGRTPSPSSERSKHSKHQEGQGKKTATPLRLSPIPDVSPGLSYGGSLSFWSTRVLVLEYTGVLVLVLEYTSTIH